MTPPETFAQAVAKVRSAGIVVIKTARNTGINSVYASYADVWDALKGPLAEAGLSVGFLPGAVRHIDAANTANSAWIQSLTMQVSCSAHCENVPFETLFPEGNRGVNLTQRQGMAHTYAKRYALLDYFHLIAGDDDDAQRLGQPVNENAAPVAAPTTHWSKLCYVPVFLVGAEESLRSWSIIADPSDSSGHTTLGDLSPQRLATLWKSYPNHPGINAWRAEIIQDRAEKKGITNWNDCHVQFKALNLPEFFTDCSGEMLNNLALALR